MRVDAIDHLHLLVPDLEKAKALFTTLIGGDSENMFGLTVKLVEPEPEPERGATDGRFNF